MVHENSSQEYQWRKLGAAGAVGQGLAGLFTREEVAEAVQTIEPVAPDPEARALGYAEGRAQAETELRAELEQVQVIGRGLQAERAQLQTRAIEDAMLLARLMFRTIFQTELVTNPGVFTKLVEQLQAALPDAEAPFCVVVHPELHQTLNRLLADAPLSALRLQADATLEPSTVRVETDEYAGELNLLANLEPLFHEALRDALQRYAQEATRTQSTSPEEKPKATPAVGGAEHTMQDEPVPQQHPGNDVE